MAVRFHRWLHLIGKHHCTCVSGVHGFAKEQKNLRFSLTYCVWVTLNRCIRLESFFNWQMKIDRRRDQALPVVIPGSLMCVCACTDLFKETACGMQHMHVYEECSWTCRIGSVLLFFYFKDWCVGGIFGTGCPLWESLNLRRMPLNTEVFVLHDWQTWRWKSTAWLGDEFLHVLTLSRTPPPSSFLLFW